MSKYCKMKGKVKKREGLAFFRVYLIMYGISRNLLLNESLHSLCFLSPKPVLPGHLIILPKRSVHKLSELQQEESADLWSMIQSMGTKLKSHFSCESLTLEFKDQVYNEFFINLIPRRPNDLESNDKIYPMLEPLLDTFENDSLSSEIQSLRN